MLFFILVTTLSVVAVVSALMACAPVLFGRPSVSEPSPEQRQATLRAHLKAGQIYGRLPAPNEPSE